MSITDQSTANLATSTGVAVAAPATPHATTGTWVVLIANTSTETFTLQLQLKSPSNQDDSSFLVYLSDGTAGNEDANLIQDPFPINTNTASMVNYPPMPITIASGARLSIKIQSSDANFILECMAFLSDDGDIGTSPANQVLGANILLSKGTPVYAGNVDNETQGYVSLGTLSIDVKYIIILIGHNDNASQTTQDFLFSLADGSETEIISWAIARANGGELGTEAIGLREEIASGTELQIAIRTNNFVSVADSTLDFVVIGYDVIPPAGGGSGGLAKLIGSNSGLIG